GPGQPVTVWDADTCRPAHVLREGTGRSPDPDELLSSFRLAFHPSGRYVVLQEFVAADPRAGSNPPAAPAAGQRLTGPSRLPRVIVWDAETGKELHNLPGGLSPDGRHVLAGDRVLDTATGRELFTVSGDSRLFGGGGRWVTAKVNGQTKA